MLRPALESVAEIFGRRRDYRKMLEAVYWHDWQSDPYSSGAYSYAGVGGGPARKQLAKSLEQTLFFAGEALDVEESFSVGGALSTGTKGRERITPRRITYRPRLSGSILPVGAPKTVPSLC